MGTDTLAGTKWFLFCLSSSPRFVCQCFIWWSDDVKAGVEFVSPCVQTVVSAAGGRHGSRSLICVWDLLNGKCRVTITYHTGSVQSLAFSRDDHFFLSVGQWPKLTIYTSFPPDMKLNELTVRKANFFSSLQPHLPLQEIILIHKWLCGAARPSSCCPVSPCQVGSTTWPSALRQTASCPLRAVAECTSVSSNHKAPRFP